MKQNWEYKKLGEVCDFRRGLTYSAGDEVTTSNNCVLRSNNIDLENSCLDLNDLKYLREDFLIPEEKKLTKNSIFICMSNGSMQHIGKIAHIDDNMNFAFGGFMGLIVPNNSAKSKYIYYNLRSAKFKLFIEAAGKGANIRNLKFSELSDFPIPLPPLATQSAIVSELDSLSAIIADHKSLLKKYDELEQAIFYDMFGDPVKNEKGWEVKKLGEIANVKIGPFGSLLHKQDYICNGIPLVNPIHMKNYKIVFDNDFTISKQKAMELDGYILKENDVILARRGDIGRCAIVTKNEDGFLCGTGSLFVRFNVGISSAFVMFMVRAESFSKDLISKAKGATMLNLNTTIVEKLDIPIPPLPLQQQFASKIESIEQMKADTKKSLEKAEELFNARMDFYFNA